MHQRKIALMGLGAACVAGSFWLTRLASECLAREFAAALGEWARAVSWVDGTQSKSQQTEISTGVMEAAAQRGSSVGVEDAVGGLGGASAQVRAQKHPRKGLHVRQATVRAAVRSGIRPAGIPVGADKNHPAGLQLIGISGAGGFRDGDVLTRINGVTPRSTEDVVGIVSGAYRKRTYTISAEFWREGEPWNAVVELPEPSDRSRLEHEGQHAVD